MANELIRITKVGGRYLVFEVKDVAALRRDHGICAVLVGTTPQMPTQNLFSGLPLELTTQEVRVLVADRKAAYVVDNAAAHLAQLTYMTDDPDVRRAYLLSLRTKRRAFQELADVEAAEARKLGEGLKARSLAKKAAAAAAKGIEAAGSPAQTESAGEAESLFSPTPSSPLSRPQPPQQPRHLTPTTSVDMISDPHANTVLVNTSRGHPLFRHLNFKGYYITPGIRFGADYSVYPGDPFRYHAHFMATSFEWDEEITVLDLVAGGRLGTGVKKGFLIGGEAPPAQTSSHGEDDRPGEDNVRAFTIEWAAM